jgi:hypothetical protein
VELPQHYANRAVVIAGTRISLPRTDNAQMTEEIYVAMLIGFPLAGILLRRWVVLLAPMIAWPIFGLGYSQGWWGDNKGDGWEFGLAVVWLFSVLTTAVATLVAIVVTRNRAKPLPTN